MPSPAQHSPLTPPELPVTPGQHRWGRLYGAARGLAIARTLETHPGLGVVITPDTRDAETLARELEFFLGEKDLPVLTLPDWETLPYDLFSPHEDIISQRMETLYRLPDLQRGILVVPVNTLMQRIAPRAWLQGRVLMLQTGARLDRDALRRNLEQAGYHCVSQVMEHGEFAVRGSLIDLFPMGSNTPYRVDLLDDEIESIRSFDPETQLSQDTEDAVRLLPAHEFPLDEEAIKGFRQRYRTRFEGDPQASVIYRDVSQGTAPAGIEYYLPLFFDGLNTLFDYLPGNVRLVQVGEVQATAEEFLAQAAQRHEQRRHDRERPILDLPEIFLTSEELKAQLTGRPGIRVERPEQLDSGAGSVNFDVAPLPDLRLHIRQADPAASLKTFLDGFHGRVLIAAESAGRREFLLDTLRPFGLTATPVEHWQAFLDSDSPLAITVAPIDNGMRMPGCGLAIITEPALFGERARQERRRKRPTRDADAVISNLTDLHTGSPVVHEEHGVGRYLGLQKLAVGGQEAEFLTLEYAGGDKLYVPVSSLHLVSRYTGADTEHAPLHKLGGEQWIKIRRKAAEKARDVAVELLEIYARRAARKGQAFDVQATDYAAFADSFPFEETPDQARAIESVLDDMASQQPMDRVVCGDVGFGKTEVAMRAAFVAANSGQQVVVLVPTTLLAQQHYQNFTDRFADWPIRIESLSRFRSAKETKGVLEGLADGRVDIVIGTHKLIQGDVKFKRLGLVIIDEEHRFGVRHKERLKALRAEVDMLTLTATPIPRTLNMALSGLRDLSIIATPPMERHAIKTFISQWNDALIQEAITREIRRGGQVYFLHNAVDSIDMTARELAELVPDADIGIAHGQMRESELERVMLDFYHRRHNVLVCTTIVESGIDVPTANTIIINRADKLGLSQLHQLRGRVGRSHHRAYAYLLTPHPSAITPDAVKRLEAIESLEDLGVGFTLASHDLEIRGAGELLGEGQSGQIQEIGFTLYNELLDRAVKAMKKGEMPDLDRPMAEVTEVDLGVPSLLPDDYVPDVHTRLILYKRISSCASEEALRELQVEMIDRFGLLPVQAKNLMAVTELRLRLQPLGVRKLEVGPQGGRFSFQATPNLDPARLIGLIQSDAKRYKMDPEQRLRFFEPMESLEQRVQAVKRILNSLVHKQEAA